MSYIEDRARQLIEQVDHSHDEVRYHALRTVCLLCDEILQFEPNLLNILIQQLPRVDSSARAENNYVRQLMLYSIGMLSQGREDVAKQLVELSNQMNTRELGWIIDAIGNTKVANKSTINWLISMFNKFEEDEHDYNDYTDHERVCQAFAKLGPQAALSATSELIKRIHREDRRDGLDDEVLRTLAAFGPAAAEAIPVLEALVAEYEYFDINDEYDYAARALRSIRGEEK